MAKGPLRGSAALRARVASIAPLSGCAAFDSAPPRFGTYVRTILHAVRVMPYVDIPAFGVTRTRHQLLTTPE